MSSKQPNGTYNTPTQPTMISSIYISVGVQQAMPISTVDTDCDDGRFRCVSTINGCDGVGPLNSLPNNTMILNTDQIFHMKCVC
ncbi:unnamed protein product [Rotaria socialis]|uniref:Uncharacterized protein n=1 Tax=Rotaria socialis TaxID=392032 RepID=A0A820CPZ8_9BILA|nr:unnamed protein product [Rotaria socialis]CAF4225757.1 unnamed protein product [Rotaria socialis]CAF4642089.1 unnamed protein product [Rotaria socialis]